MVVVLHQTAAEVFGILEVLVAGVDIAVGILVAESVAAVVADNLL